MNLNKSEPKPIRVFSAEARQNMKNHLCSLFHCGRANMANANTAAKRKLILHFDVNKTIVPVDSGTGETVEDALNVFLSGMAWGKDREGKWYSKEELSTSPLEVDDVSFYKFEEKRMLPNIAHDRAAFRYELMSFTDRPQGSNFKPYLNTLLQSLKWNLPYDEQLHDTVTVPGTKSCRYHFIIPAFYTVLRHLVAAERNFRIVFRTYGIDAKSVLTSIDSAITQSLPFCEHLGFLANNNPEGVYELKRDASDDSFTVQLEGSEDDSHATRGLTDDDMYSWLTNGPGVRAIRDNVEDWYTNNFDSKKGKPIWVDCTDVNTQHVFFDDNIRPGSSDSIANLRIRDKNSSGGFRNAEMCEEYIFKNSTIVPVNFTEAILDENYFVKKLELCEENYTRHLHS